MCLNLFKKSTQSVVFTKPFVCSCDICCKQFMNMETLIKHMATHDTRDLNARLNANCGTVRCSTCFHSFRNVYDMRLHSCVTRIRRADNV